MIRKFVDHVIIGGYVHSRQEDCHFERQVAEENEAVRVVFICRQLIYYSVFVWKGRNNSKSRNGLLSVCVFCFLSSYLITTWAVAREDLITAPCYLGSC